MLKPKVAQNPRNRPNIAKAGRGSSPVRPPVIPNVRAEQAAAALQELTDEQFVRVVKAEGQRRAGRGKAN